MKALGILSAITASAPALASFLTAVIGYATVAPDIDIAVQRVSVVPSIVKVASARLMAHILTSKPPEGLFEQELVTAAAILDAQAMSVYFIGKTFINSDFTHIVSEGVIVNLRYG